MEKRLINFWNNCGEPYFLDEIQFWDDSMWEERHDFIQWIFPTKKISNYNLEAPVLDDTTITYLKQLPAFNMNLTLLVNRFKMFLTKNSQFVSPNHNWLRISRVIDCLSIFGLYDVMFWFYDYCYVSMIDKTHPSIEVWKSKLHCI